MSNRVKPNCKLIGEDGNVFNLLGKASRMLKDNGQSVEAKEMSERIMDCASYNEALNIIGEYVNIVGDEEHDIEMNIN